MSTIYIVSKLFTYLVLPPGIFIIFFVIASFFTKKFKFIFILTALSFYALSNSYVSDFLLKPLERPFNKTLDKTTKVDAVIVLGGGSIVGSANLPLANDAYKRALWGVMVAKKQNLPLLFSGAGFYKKYTEADAFLDSMQEIQDNLHVEMNISKSLHVNSFSLHVEDKSLDTYQNAKFSKEKFTELGIDKPTIYLVTSAYHMKRSIKLYEHFGFRVIPAATGFRLSNKAKNNWDYLPSIGALHDSYTALHEYAGLFSLTLRGI
jgi:uncharacterized SAM-binding protein YcdF (DUF218 family)